VDRAFLNLSKNGKRDKAAAVSIGGSAAFCWGSGTGVMPGEGERDWEEVAGSWEGGVIDCGDREMGPGE
jgi:hypothetical protein